MRAVLLVLGVSLMVSCGGTTRPAAARREHRRSAPRSSVPQHLLPDHRPARRGPEPVDPMRGRQDLLPTHPVGGAGEARVWEVLVTWNPGSDPQARGMVADRHDLRPARRLTGGQQRFHRQASDGRRLSERILAEDAVIAVDIRPFLQP